MIDFSDERSQGPHARLGGEPLFRLLAPSFSCALLPVSGSYGLLEVGALSGWSNGPFYMLFTASGHLFDGFREHGRENSQKAFSSFGYRISEAMENRFYIFWGRFGVHQR